MYSHNRQTNKLDVTPAARTPPPIFFSPHYYYCCCAAVLLPPCRRALPCRAVPCRAAVGTAARHDVNNITQSRRFMINPPPPSLPPSLSGPPPIHSIIIVVLSVFPLNEIFDHSVRRQAIKSHESLSRSSLPSYPRCPSPGKAGRGA